MVPDSAIAIMGHWGSKDPMPGTYDSASVNTELVYKSYVCRNYVQGWRLVPYGAVPIPAVVPWNAPDVPEALCASSVVPSEVAPEPASESVPCGLRKGAAVQLELDATFGLPAGIIHVVNLKTGVVHLYQSGKSVVCGSFKCGCREEPHKDAHFASPDHAWSGSSAPYDFCSACFSERSYRRLGAVRISGLDSSDESDASSSSSSS